MDFTDLKSGVSVEGHPIPAYRGGLEKSQYIYLLAGVHGDEVEGVYLLQQIFDCLHKGHNTKGHAIDLPLIVVPILNVDGYRLGQRQNSHGVDLNRNLPTHDWGQGLKDLTKYNPGPAPLSEPENQYLMHLFDEFPPAFLISFHTWKAMINYNGNCREYAEYLSNYNKYPIVEDIGHATPGSMGNFLTEKFHVPSLTFECPPITEEKSLKDIWSENKMAFEKLFKGGKLNLKNLVQRL